MDNKQEKKFAGIRNLVEYSLPYKNKVVFVLVLALIGAIFILMGPRQIEQITNLISQGIKDGYIDIVAINRVGAFLLSLYIVGFIVNYLKHYLMAGITQQLNDSLRMAIAEKINKLPLSYFNTISYGDVLSRVTNDVDTIGKTLNNSLPMIITCITLLAGSLLMMLTSNIRLALSVVGVTLVGFGGVKFITRKSQPYFNAQQKLLGEMNGFAEEIYSGHAVVQMYRADATMRKEFMNINNRLSRNGRVAHFLSGIMMPLMSFIGNLSYVVVAVLGSKMVVEGKIQFGVVVAFTMYIRQFNNPLSQLTQIITEMQTASAASLRVREFLNEEEIVVENNITRELRDVKGKLDIRDVSFGYTDDKLILNNISFSANPGNKIAIVGPTGSGKTTFINLLMRFFDANKGDILIDNTSIFDVSLENLRNQFAMVLQDTWIFEGTVWENLVYTNEHISQQQVEEACRRVGIDHFIESLPQGYQTVLDEKTTLSEGQKQQFTIVRAILKNAPLLILDEATSSIDTRTEVIIQDAMMELMKGRTSLVIAHRLSTIKDADCIIVMKDGNIVETGRHSVLLEKNGFYSELYNSQFQ